MTKKYLPLSEEYEQLRDKYAPRVTIYEIEPSPEVARYNQLIGHFYPLFRQKNWTPPQPREIDSN